ncbi:ketopantoate reductase family protein (plasmid) [Paraburkholderia sp. PREW-6R]|uniref:ketopantoate reductase family protein n=1 Tax=Paraburkholderia sp. PREW-6R TaxID=3141544 RepID=UPI0031F4B62B
MKILVVGAGALGGYFGARLLENGADVTFLLRAGRARQIANSGLIVHSPFGDTVIKNPQVVSRESLAAAPTHYDVIVVGCKAYDLDDTMDAFAPAVRADTAIVPLLNGIAHLARLRARFSDANVLGGYCLISAALDQAGHIHHLNDSHQLYFGELDGALSDRVQHLRQCFAGARCEAIASERIVERMWEKWVQIATAAGMTTLMRASIGTIVSSGGASFARALFDECAAIASKAGYPLSEEAANRISSVVTDASSLVTASMMKDMERLAQVEADHLIGELIELRDNAESTRSATTADQISLLDLVMLNLRAYQRRHLAPSS